MADLTKIDFSRYNWRKLFAALSELQDGIIPAGSVGLAELADGILAASVSGLVKMADGFLSADAGGRAKMADGFLTTAKLGAAAVTKAKASVFVSTEQTGNGSSQDVAHGLGATPTLVLVVPTLLSDAAAETGFTTTEGVHDGTNVKVTVTNTVKYKVMAWA